MRMINCVAIVPRRICTRRIMTAPACMGIDIVYALPLRNVVACSARALSLYARARSGFPTNSLRYASMSRRFSAPMADARNVDANSAGVCGTRPLKPSRTRRADEFVTNKEELNELRTEYPIARQRTGHEEIRGSLAMRGFVPEVNEVLPGLVSSPIISHPAFVNYADFVEMFIQLFSRLVYRYDCCKTHDICRYPQRSDKF